MVYPLTKITLGRYAYLYVKDIRGKENFPKDSSFIIAANHASYYDDLLLPLLIFMFAKKKVHMYVNSRFFKNYFLKKFLDHHECIPVDVKKDKNSEKVNKDAFHKALAYIKKGEVIGIFPEGHRSLDGKMQKAKTGIARLALAAKVPVVPVGIIGSYHILPKGKMLPRFKRCSVQIGKPLDFTKYYGKEDKKTALKVTDIIMHSIARLSKQKYIHGGR